MITGIQGVSDLDELERRKRLGQGSSSGAYPQTSPLSQLANQGVPSEAYQPADSPNQSSFELPRGISQALVNTVLGAVTSQLGPLSGLVKSLAGSYIDDKSEADTWDSARRSVVNTVLGAAIPGVGLPLMLAKFLGVDPARAVSSLFDSRDYAKLGGESGGLLNERSEYNGYTPGERYTPGTDNLGDLRLSGEDLSTAAEISATGMAQSQENAEAGTNSDSHATDTGGYGTGFSYSSSGNNNYSPYGGSGYSSNSDSSDSGGYKKGGKVKSPLSMLAQQGRNGDTRVAHLTPGEVVIPAEVVDNSPELMRQIEALISQLGGTPDELYVGQGRTNPHTGLEEFATEEEITKAYQDRLGRAPDAAGMDYWKNQADLSGFNSAAYDETTRNGVAALYSASDKASSERPADYLNIDQAYGNMFGRQADQGGADYWRAQNNDSEQGSPELLARMLGDSSGTDRAYAQAHGFLDANGQATNLTKQSQAYFDAFNNTTPTSIDDPNALYRWSDGERAANINAANPMYNGAVGVSNVGGPASAGDWKTNNTWNWNYGDGSLADVQSYYDSLGATDAERNQRLKGLTDGSVWHINDNLSFAQRQQMMDMNGGKAVALAGDAQQFLYDHGLAGVRDSAQQVKDDEFQGFIEQGMTPAQAQEAQYQASIARQVSKASPTTSATNNAGGAMNWNNGNAANGAASQPIGSTLRPTVGGAYRGTQWTPNGWEATQQMRDEADAVGPEVWLNAPTQYAAGGIVTGPLMKLRHG